MQISPQRYRHITVAALVALAIIIVTGAAVRFTNSGLGCDDWPNCSSERFVDVSSKHAAIEQINRLFTGVVGFAAIAAVLGAFLRVPRRRDLTVLSVLVAGGVVANAVLGGISVLVDLHPLAVQAHLLLSMALIVTGTVLVRRAGEPDGVARQRVVTIGGQRLTWVLFALTWVAVFTGTLVTGAGPHAGDENAERLDLDIPSIARVHGATVILTIAAALVIAWRARRTSTGRRPAHLADLDVVVRRRAPGRRRVRAVLQRRPRVARRHPRGRRHGGDVGDDPASCSTRPGRVRPTMTIWCRTRCRD